MFFKQLDLLLVLIVALIASVSTAVTASVVNPSPAEMAVPLCSQTQLVRAGTLLATNVQKKHCETMLNMTEMLRFEVEHVEQLCATAACTAAFEQLYTTLPSCRYQDWPIKFNFKRLLQHCGIDPHQLTAASIDGEDAGESAQDFNGSSSSSGSGSFATIGAPTTTVPECGDIAYKQHMYP